MNRRKLTAKQRLAVFETAKGICHICNLPIVRPKETWELEHIKPLWRDGPDAPSNWAPAHDHCHKEKTAREAFERAKDIRVRAKHVGAKPKRPWAPKAPKAMGEKEAQLRRMREGNL